MSDRSTSTAAASDAGFASRVDAYRRRVDDEIDRWLVEENVSNAKLLEAMRYALLGGGKRIRPLLTYASSEFFGVAVEQADAIAAAIEMIHAYSLVHDDLPAMDDDDLRRGRATVHIAFDEATAILVGDALHALAFQVLTDHPALVDHPRCSVALVRQLARAVGPEGMVAGQALDLALSGQEISQRALEDMFERKTGRLICAAITMPEQCAENVRPATATTVQQLAEKAGLCFQIHDDVLDVTCTTEQIGKPSGSDIRNGRSAFPARFGLEAARARAQELYDGATVHLDELGPQADGLRWATTHIIMREN